MDCKTAQQKIMPYIERKLSDREMEDFIDHIRGCEACSEELEVYFTIFYALEQLEREEQGNYDIHKLLEKNLDAAEKKIRNHAIMRFYRRLIFGVLTLVMTVLLFTVIQMFIMGSFEKTTLYQLFSVETEAEESRTSGQSETEAAEEETQQATNRKQQVIVTTPETEAWEQAAPEAQAASGTQKTPETQAMSGAQNVPEAQATPGTQKTP
ncbi:MAG: zf-HC2 domain-containing protein, partial [Eubacteriales bacterium]|nr:zf-HC2 domain-containing protein [Eubacteriales bacterium]